MSTKKQKRSGNKKGRTAPPYPAEFRLRIVRLYLEEGYSAPLLAQEFGLGCQSIRRWLKAYREHGEEGLRSKRRAPVKKHLTEDVKGRIVDLKRSNPGFGTRRISDILKRFFLIRTSPSSVHRTLSQKGLISRKKQKPAKNPSKPRFFERATANQLWQSDIMTFRLAGRNAYLIGFIDDYSRYVTGLGFYRSQTAEHVLETYRKAIGEYGVPKEMLTDNGRQYTNWRGTTRFERELQKDRVKHIKSRPHHPMTLGKIERFWKTILGEFLQRAQFGSYEEAVERTAFWIKYYNYKRPHQGIGGLCPADRFFEIQSALKKTLEKGVEDNALELALRGKPRDPFYMVGRMGDQSVVIRAEKGKVKMLVDGEDGSREKELVYDARKDIDHENSQEKSQIVRSPSEDNGRAVDLDGATHDQPDMQGDVHQRGSFGPLAEPGHGGDAHGAESEKSRETGGVERPVDPIDRKEAAGSHGETGKAAQSDPEGRQDRQPIVTMDGAYDTQVGGDSPAEGRVHHEGPVRPDDGFSGGERAGGIAQDLLQVGKAGPGSPVGQRIGPEGRQTGKDGADRRIGPGETTCRNGPGERVVATENGIEGYSRRDQCSIRIGSDEKKMSRSCGP